ncbi:hypothetical protein FACS1894187_24020 [Synergistales bacterium]|nr:hypothetical protein FACS1894187_24020 [Synergistales bacterium]
MEQSNMNDGRLWFDDEDPDGIHEMIQRGEAIFFQFRGRDYFIERGWCGGGGYVIQDPQIGLDGKSRDDIPYTDYPGHLEAKTPEEMTALPFLDGKTIFERFGELQFFDI